MVICCVNEYTPEHLRPKIHLEKLPDSFNCLISLRHLHNSDKTTLPLEIGKLTSLRTLAYFCVGDEKGFGISELGHLKDLKGKLEIHNLEKVRDKNEAMSADLIGKSGIHKIKLVWGESREGEDESNIDESVLEGLEPHPDLKKIVVEEYKGKSLPPWAAVQLNNLMKIELKNCRKLEEVSVMTFPSSLRELRISNCRSLRKLPDDLHILNSLETLYISYCPDLKSIPYSPSSRGGGQQQQQQLGFTSLKELNIKFVGLTDLSIEMLESCALSLETLSLYELSNLTNFSEVIGCCLHRMTRLTHLNINRAPEFSIISFSASQHHGDLKTVSSLKSLSMSPSLSWNNVLSFNNTVDAMLLQLITSLRQLTLGGMEDWHRLPAGIQHGMEHWHRLPAGIQHGMEHWHRLPAGIQHGMEHWHRLPAGIQHGMEHWHRLPAGIQHGMEHRHLLPDGIQHLTSLKVLRLSDFGIVEFPEWFGNLSSLGTLELHNCKKLRRLPSIQAMQRLSKLTYLDIDECPLLLREGPQIVDLEWAKISHIPTIRVNHRPYSHHGH